jgi:hypothetical protein
MLIAIPVTYFACALFELRTVALLFIRVLEKHVFIDSEIGRSISARDVCLSVMHNCEPIPVLHHQTVSS